MHVHHPSWLHRTHSFSSSRLSGVYVLRPNAAPSAIACWSSSLVLSSPHRRRGAASSPVVDPAATVQTEQPTTAQTDSAEQSKQRANGLHAASSTTAATSQQRCAVTGASSAARTHTADCNSGERPDRLTAGASGDHCLLLRCCIDRDALCDRIGKASAHRNPWLCALVTADSDSALALLSPVSASVLSRDGAVQQAEGGTVRTQRHMETAREGGAVTRDPCSLCACSIALLT